MVTLNTSIPKGMIGAMDIVLLGGIETRFAKFTTKEEQRKWILSAKFNAKMR